MDIYDDSAYDDDEYDEDEESKKGLNNKTRKWTKAELSALQIALSQFKPRTDRDFKDLTKEIGLIRTWKAVKGRARSLGWKKRSVTEFMGDYKEKSQKRKTIQPYPLTEHQKKNARNFLTMTSELLDWVMEDSPRREWLDAAFKLKKEEFELFSPS